MKNRTLLAALLICIAGCDPLPAGVDDIPENPDVLTANAETIGQVGQAMSKEHRMVITADADVIASFDDPALQFLYSEKTRVDLDRGWVLYTMIPHSLLLDMSAAGLAADGQDPPEPDCVVDDVDNIPWYAVGSRWGSFLSCMRDVAEERCGGILSASYDAEPALDDQGTPDDEEDDHYDMHGFVTCRTPR